MPPESLVGEVGLLQNWNPRVGPATCADPPSLCAGWGGRETLKVLVPVLQEKHWHGGAQDRADSRLEPPIGKSRHRGRPGASDPPGSRSGSPMVNSSATAAGPSKVP